MQDHRKIIRDYLLLELYYLYALFQNLLGKNLSEQSLSGLAADLKAAEGHAIGDDSTSENDAESHNAEEIQRIETLRQSILSRYGDVLPLIRLRNELQYDEIEHLLLILALAPMIDPRFEELYRSIADDISHHPLKLGFVPMLLGYEWTRRLDIIARSGPDNPLRELGIIHCDPLSRRMWVDERILHFALGHNFSPPVLATVCPSYQCDFPADALGVWTDPLSTELAKMGHSDRLHVYLPDSSAGEVAAYVCARLGLETININLSRLVAAEDPQTLVDVWLREALLRFAIPVLEISDDWPNREALAENPIIEYLNDKLRHWPQGFLICSHEQALPLPVETLPSRSLELPKFDVSARRAVWTELFADIPRAEHRDRDFDVSMSRSLDQIANAYHYDMRTSVRIGKRTQQRMKQLPQLDLHSALIQECRVEAQRTVTHLGQYSEPRFDFDDIVLPVTTKDQLKELCHMARLQDQLRQQWGFGVKLMTVPSITALFAGPSGTGKTMAAEIIAGYLGRPLLRVDLAAVVSKYIGETEKNLERVFSQAESSCSLLFFDEADALFGKRSEVKEAHDRYANIEISYLLQRMEHYRGIAILASNLRQHLDDAFVRRLTMTVLFPFPSWEQRAQIWRHSIPEQTPFDEALNFDDIARRFKLSGGNIRNAVIAAAYQAAISKSVMDERCVMHGIRREMQKMGKQLAMDDSA